jgi:hypothetical protein
LPDEQPYIRCTRRRPSQRVAGGGGRGAAARVSWASEAAAAALSGGPRNPAELGRSAAEVFGGVTPEGIITTREVRRTADGRALEVLATLDAGEVVPGMFVHIPLNGMLDLTVPVAAVTHENDTQLRLVLDCGDEAGGAELVAACNFEALWVLATGER